MKKYFVLAINIALGFALFFLQIIVSNILMNNFIPQWESSSLILTPISFAASAYIMGKLNIGKKSWNYGWRDDQKLIKFAAGSIMAIIIVSLGSAAIILTDTVKLQVNVWAYSSIALQLVVLLLVAVGEELFFRGFIYEASKEVTGTLGIILINAALFAGIHLLNAGAAEQPFEFIAVGLMNIVLITVIFTQARAYTQSLWMPIGLHFMFNVTQSCLFGFVNGGKVAASMYKLDYLKPSILNGGEFGMEASLLLTPILIMAIFLFGIIWPKGKPEA